MRGLERELYDEKIRVKKMLNQIYKEDICGKSKEKVIVKIRGNSFMFYTGENEKRKYIPMSEKEHVIDLVKAEYHEKMKDVLERRHRIINSAINGLQKTNPVNVYESLGKGKQKIINPLLMTDEQYRTQWENLEYEGKEFGEDSAEIYTDKGERVRSKSEKIIADKLFKENIPYRYEYPMKLSNGKILYPDFTLLDELKRRNIIFEHFGMMDNEEYMNNAISKIRLYVREGYVWGETFFFTMETKENPLDTRVIDNIIGALKA